MTPALSKEQALIREATLFPERITTRQCALTAVKSVKPRKTGQDPHAREPMPKVLQNHLHHPAPLEPRLEIRNPQLSP